MAFSETKKDYMLVHVSIKSAHTPLELNNAISIYDINY